MSAFSWLRCFSGDPSAIQRSNSTTQASQTAASKKPSDNGTDNIAQLLQLSVALHDCMLGQRTALEQLQLALSVVKSQLGVSAASVAALSRSRTSYCIIASTVKEDMPVLAVHPVDSMAPNSCWWMSEQELRCQPQCILNLLAQHHPASCACLPLNMSGELQAVLVLRCQEGNHTLLTRVSDVAQILQCWLVQPLNNGLIRNYVTQLEVVETANTMQELAASVCAFVLAACEGLSQNLQLKCSVAVIDSTSSSATHFAFNAVAASPPDRHWSTAHHPFIDSPANSGPLPVLPMAQSVLGGVWAVNSSPVALDVVIDTNGANKPQEQVVSRALPVVDTMLGDVLSRQEGIIVMDCLKVIQGSHTRCSEVMHALGGSCPGESALLVDVLYDAEGKPRMGVYLVSPLSSGSAFIRKTLPATVQEAMLVMNATVVRKLNALVISAFESQDSRSSSDELLHRRHRLMRSATCADLGAGPCNAANAPDPVAPTSPKTKPRPVRRPVGKSKSTSQLLPLVAGLQDQLHCMQRINTQAGDARFDDLRSLRLIDLVGEGGFGRVFIGRYRGMSLAVKVVPWSSNDSCVMDKALELAALTSLNHPHVVQVITYFSEAMMVYPLRPHPHKGKDLPNLLSCETWQDEHRSGSQGGYRTATRCMVLCMSYCDMGTLKDAIVKGYFSGAKFGTSTKPNLITLSPSLQIILLVLLEVAGALAYLHRMQVVHRDIKPSNILLRSCRSDIRGFTTHLSDFGLAQVVRGSEVIPEDAPATSLVGASTAFNMKFTGTLTHCPPEALMDSKQVAVTGALDMYAFGILMWELYTSAPLYGGMGKEEVFAGVTRAGLRPSFPLACPVEYRALAQRCWAENAKNRPSAEQVLVLLEAMLDKETKASAQRSANQLKIASMRKAALPRS